MKIKDAIEEALTHLDRPMGLGVLDAKLVLRLALAELRAQEPRETEFAGRKRPLV